MIVWHTNLELEPGKIYDTRKWAHLNQRAVEESPQAVQEVEELLEEVRADQFPDLPRRPDSILAIPWPKHPYSERIRKHTVTSEERVMDPPGAGAYCYYISLLPETVSKTLDETYVTGLVRRWRDMRNSHERWSIAAEYWDGGFLEAYSILIEGIFRVDELCSGGAAPVWGVETAYGYGRQRGALVSRPRRQTPYHED